ncbi:MULTISPECIES: TonB-dependent receptor plug domain-containing protein [Chitinophagaceae]
MYQRQKAYRFLIVTVFSWTLIFVHSALWAQEDHILDSVSIYSSKMFPQLASPVPVQILSDSALHRLNAFSVADAIRYFAGVQLKDYGGIGGLKTVDIRNMGANHTGVLYDGVPITNMQNGQVDLGKFSLDNMDAISLYNAGTNSMLQPASAYASGATIYLTSKKTVFSDREKTHLKATINTGSFGIVNPSVLFQQKLSSFFSLQLNAERVAADGRYKFTEKVKDAYDTTATRENGDIHAWRTEAGLFGRFKDSSFLHTQVYYYTSDRGLPGAVVNNKFESPQRLWDRNFFVQSQYDKRFSDQYHVSFVGKYAYDYTHYFDPTIIGDDGALNNYYYARELFLSMANEFSLNRYWKTQLSVDYKYNHLNANLDNFAYPTRNTVLAVIATQYQKDRWTLQGNLLGSFIYNKVQFGQKATDRRVYTPTVDFAWQPLQKRNFTLRGFYKNIFRMPTFNDLYYTDIGTVALKPEFVKQYDIGFTYWKILDSKNSSVSLQVDAFHNDIKDKIVAMPAQNLFRWKMVNLTKVKTNGINASIKNEWHWNEHFHIGILLQYNYLDAKNKTEGNAYNSPVPYSSTNSGSAVVNVRWYDWNLDYSYLYTGGRYNITDLTLPYSWLQPWYTHDLGLTKELRIKMQKIKVSAQVNNILNQQYEVILNYPMPGRNYRIGVQYNL